MQYSNHVTIFNKKYFFLKYFCIQIKTDTLYIHKTNKKKNNFEKQFINIILK